ncbi:hypothetical protein F0562_008934 [Nyssa sinensis]|uniref:E3 ubiquitin-protein ligase RMA n=1 Tax=Nyssa sinensis TaxID=561372 RepID=A0A5J5ABL2_9ASTE|nr:hypothetical protein F0562_008934 [Nyssa sinensis]
MAGVLETITVPRAAGFPAYKLAPVASNSVSALPRNRKSVKFSEFRGLKIKSSSSTRYLGSVGLSSRLVRPGARIVCEAQETAVQVPPVTDPTWQSLVLESDLPTLVEFWAPWCGPCRMIHPVIDELAKQYTGKLKCYKVNTDESPSIATRYGIRSIPTVMIFKNGEKKDTTSYLSIQMAFEQNFQEPTVDFESDGDVSLKQKWKSISAPPTVSENVNGCFECNICLDSVHDPVVTLCGHLYCWPCIYKWLHVQSSALESDEQPKCPVCKANISHSSLVPLYGRGTSPSESDAKKPQLDLVIPRRPPALGVHTVVTSMTSHPNQQLNPTPFQSQPQPFPHPYGNYASMAQSNFGGTTMNSISSPTVGMFGEMVFARFFGSSDTSLFAYPHSNSFPVTGSGSPRMRRQEMQVDKSLNRISIFLFCCFVLCLLLF